MEEPDLTLFDEQAMRALVGCARGRLGMSWDRWLDETRGPADVLLPPPSTRSSGT